MAAMRQKKEEHMKTVIETDRLTKSYGKSRGIRDLTLQVGEGEIFGFIGPNGAGKSTTIRTLLGLITPTSGTASVLGMDISHRREILARTGYMAAEASFYPGMRVSQLLALSASLRGMDCTAEAKRLCERFELDTQKKVETLSLGNRKKAAIVCAFQHKPDLYILDEPTSGLDPLMQREFYALLREYNEQGASVFLSSHVLSEIQRYCRQAAVIREGRILVSDRVENLGHTGTKRVTVRGISGIPQLENIRDAHVSGDTVSFLYSGRPDALLKALSAQPVEDLTVCEPDLEEIFLHYYAREEKENDNHPA